MSKLFTKFQITPSSSYREKCYEKLYMNTVMWKIQSLGKQEVDIR